MSELRTLFDFSAMAVTHVQLSRMLTFGSMKMYKTQIARWNLAKNYRATEKEHVARVLKTSYETGSAPTPLNIRGRPIQLHRVRRHCKKQGSLPAVLNNALAALSEADRSEVDTWIKSHGGRLIPARRSEFPQKLLSLRTTNDRIELVLKQTEIYLENAYLTIDTNDVNPSKAWAFNYKVWGAGRLMATSKFDAGWCELALACDKAHEVLEEGAVELLRAVVSWLYHPAYNKFPEARLHVLRFLARLSAAKLGTRHPLSVVLFHVLDDEVFSDIIRPYFEVMKDTMLRIRAMDRVELASIQLNEVEYLIGTIKDLKAAESVCLQCVEICVNGFGRNAFYTRSALRQLGRIYERRGCYDDAITIYQDVLSRRSGNGSEPDSMDVSATMDLARVYEDQGDAKQSVEYWHRTLEMALAIWDLDDSETTLLIVQLEESFRFQGLDPEPWLQGYFGIFNH